MMMLFGENASGLGDVGFDRQGVHVLNSIFMLSCEELQAIEKRASFMEKLKKISLNMMLLLDVCMSEISKELAFNYRTYIQKRTQLIDSFSTLSAKIPLAIENPSFAVD